MRYEIYRSFKQYGEMLYSQGLISLTAGNMSIIDNNSIYITASGSLLGELKYDDIVEVPYLHSLVRYSWSSKKPSVELKVHRAVYENTAYKAIVHVHSPTAIALSFDQDKLILPDDEAKYYLPLVPVLAVEEGISSDEVARDLPALLAMHKAVIVRGHGVFAAAENIKEAASLVSTIEFSAQILYKKQRIDNC